MKKSILSLLVLSLSIFSITAFSLTCPYPKDFKYQNGQWVAPQGWTFNQYPEGASTDQVDKLVQVEWQAIIKGGHQGSVDWCKYTWKNEKSLDELSVMWMGDPMFVQPANMSYWTPLSDGKAFRCSSSVANCAFIPGTFG